MGAFECGGGRESGCTARPPPPSVLASSRRICPTYCRTFCNGDHGRSTAELNESWRGRKCTRWFLNKLAGHRWNQRPNCPSVIRGPVRSGCGSRPAVFAGPICMSSMANCRTLRSRSSLAMKSSAGSMRSAPASRTCMQANASASPGWATPAASANFARAAVKICAIIHHSTAIRATAVSRPIQSPMRASRFPSVKLATMRLWPHFACLCAGLIGWRSLVIAGEGKNLGLYGFGAAAHIVAQVARFQGRSVFAFTRPGDTAAQNFARGLGAVWAGGSDEMPPEPLDAAIIFAEQSAPCVPLALAAVRKGGRKAVCCGDPHEATYRKLSLRTTVGRKRTAWFQSPLITTRRDGLSIFWPRRRRSAL